MEARTFACFLFVICFFLLSEVPLTSGKKCKFQQKYVCGIQDCNCRYVSSDTYSFSNLYNRFYALFSRENLDENAVCDKCDVFCSKEKHINCHQGACDKQKGCICRDCWSGEACSEYQNNNVPEFKDTVYKAEIKKDANIDEEILQLSAIDPDLELCVDKDNCPCGQIKYSITTGNKNGLFHIDPDSGIIRLSKKLSDADYFEPIFLQVLAENAGAENLQEGQSLKSAAAVTISVTQERNDVVRKRRSLLTHHRARRSVTSYDALTTTFSPQTNVSFFSAGCPISFRLSVAQNTSSSPKALTGISVILSSTHLHINKDTFDVNITVSSVVKHLSPAITETNPSKWEFSIADALGTSDSLDILFEATVKNTAKPLSLLQVGFTLNAATGSGDVQYGPTYSTVIYAAYPQTTFTRNTSATYVSVETTLDYHVYMTLPYFNFSLVFEISTTINTLRFLSIESVTKVSESSSVLLQNKNPTPLKYTGATDNVTSRVVLDFGEVKVLDKNQSLNTLTLEFSVKVNDHYLLENSSSHWVGIGVRTGDQMLWVGQEKITIFKEEPFLIAEIKTLNNTAPTRYYMDDVLHFTWTVYHANASYALAKNVVISILPSNSLTLVGDTIDVGATPSSLGDNGKKYQLTTAEFPKSSRVNGTVKVKVNNNNVAPLADLNIEIRLNYKTPDDVDRPVKTYRPSPGYFAGIPTFNLSSNITDRKIKIGKAVEISLRILIKKIALTADIEVILPVQNESAVMRYVPNSFKTKSVGSNIKGSQLLTNPERILNSTASNSPTYFDRAKVNFGEISNNDISANSILVDENNVLDIKFEIVLEDHEYIINNTTYWIGVGVKGGPNMVWISRLAFTTDVQLNRQAKVMINPNTNGTGILKQGDVVQYNFTISHTEVSDAHARDVEVLWMMPAYTKFLRLVTNSHNTILKKTGNNLLFKLSKLDFLESPSISFLSELDPDKTLKPGKNYAVSPIALTYKNVPKSEALFYHPLIPMSVVFTVPTPPLPLTSAVEGFYNRGYLVDNSSSAIYICKVSKKRNKPSCFWTNTKGAVWKAVDILVVNIIGIDHANQMVYGIGNNRMAYMKYVPSRRRWYSISREHWQLAKQKLSDKRVVSIDDAHDNEGDPEPSKEHSVGNQEKWGANKIGVYYYMPNGGWDRKAVWDCCLFNE